jgi:hypothetical protein
VHGNSDIFHQEMSFELVTNHFLQYVIGSFILSTSAATILGISSYLLLQKFNPENKATV